MYKRHIIGMLTSSRNDSHHQQLCSSVTNTLPQSTTFWVVFWTWKTACAETIKFFTAVHMWKAIHVCCFKNGLNRCRISGQKAEWITKKTKHVLASWGGTCGAISPISLVWVCTMAHHLYSRFHPQRFWSGEVITEKHVYEALNKCNIGSLSL